VKHEIAESGVLKVGTDVKCKPRVGPKFKGQVTRILADDEGNVVEVEVLQISGTGTRQTKRQIRTMLPEAVSGA